MTHVVEGQQFLFSDLEYQPTPATKAQNPPSQPRRQTRPAIKQIPLERINLGDKQLREHPGDLTALKASIRKLGVHTPITLTPDSDDPQRYLLLAGYRRYHAAQALGHKHLPALIINNPPPELPLVDNLQREDLNAIEKTAAVLEHIAHNLDTSTDRAIAVIRQYARGTLAEPQRTQLAVVEAELNVNLRSFTSNRLSLMSLPEPIKDALRQRRITESVALELGRITDPDTQARLLARAVAGEVTRADLRKLRKAQQPLPAMTPAALLKSLESAGGAAREYLEAHATKEGSEILHLIKQALARAAALTTENPQ